MHIGEPFTSQTRLDNFFNKIEFGTSCWEWCGPTRSGYGQFKYRDKSFTKQVSAHRLMYLIAIGPIGANCQVDHLCSNRSCVNPDHLEAVTPSENVLRSYQRNKNRKPVHRASWWPSPLEAPETSY